MILNEIRFKYISRFPFIYKKLIMPFSLMMVEFQLGKTKDTELNLFKIINMHKEILKNNISLKW